MLVILYIGCHQPLQAVLVRMRQCIIVITMCDWDKGLSVRVIDVKDALYECVEFLESHLDVWRMDSNRFRGE